MKKMLISVAVLVVFFLVPIFPPSYQGCQTVATKAVPPCTFKKRTGFEFLKAMTAKPAPSSFRQDLVTENNDSEKASDSCESLKNSRFISTKAFLQSEGDGLRKSSIQFAADGKFSHYLSDYALGETYTCENNVITFKRKIDNNEIYVEYNSENKSFTYKGYEYIKQ